MQAKINISGLIGPIAGPGACYTFANLVADVKQAREAGATSLLFVIDSDGGMVDEGFLMASYIERLGLPTKAVAVRAFSIASILLFATDEREIEENGMLMLHGSWYQGVSGNADELRAYAEALDRSTRRMASYIASRASITEEELIGLMGIDRYIEKEEAGRLGLMDVPARMKDFAMVSHTKKSMKQQIKDALAVIAKAFGMDGDGQKMAMDVELEDGTMIFVDSEDGEFVGKPTNAPDGTHRLRDGRTITVANGIVEAVTEDATNMEGQAAMDDEKKRLMEQNAELQAKIQEMEGQYAALEAKVLAIAKATTSGAVPTAKHPRFNQPGQNPNPADRKPERKAQLSDLDEYRKRVQEKQVKNMASK